MKGLRQRWEGLCRQCGLCCYEKEYQGRWAITNFARPCRFLDTATLSCTVYERRFAACPECGRMTLRHALFVKWLPPSCGYVRAFRPWRNPGRRRMA